MLVNSRQITNGKILNRKKNSWKGIQIYTVQMLIPLEINSLANNFQKVNFSTRIVDSFRVYCSFPPKTHFHLNCFTCNFPHFFFHPLVLLNSFTIACRRQYFSYNVTAKNCWSNETKKKTVGKSLSSYEKHIRKKKLCSYWFFAEYSCKKFRLTTNNSLNKKNHAFRK